MRLWPLPECLPLLAWIRWPSCGARKFVCGRHAEEDAGEQRDAGAEDQDGRVDVDRGFVREGIHREHGGDGVDTFVGGENAERRAGDGKQDRLGEQLADQAAAAGADRNADGEFVLAGGASSEQQDRDVGAADDQQRDDRAEQQNERTGKFAEDFFVQRDDLGAALLRVVLVELGEIVGQDLELGFGFVERRVGLQPDERHPVIVRIGAGRGRQ